MADILTTIAVATVIIVAFRIVMSVAGFLLSGAIMGAVLLLAYATVIGDVERASRPAPDWKAHVSAPSASAASR